MRVLLVHPKFPTTYWGFQYSLPLIDKGATLPPLGLISLAALLPQAWELRLVDINIETLRDDQLNWADVVLVTGMLIQEPSMKEVLRRATAAACRTVVGGPACTTSPDRFAEADQLFLGEAEGRVDELIAAIEAHPGTARVLPAPSDRPSLELAPVPRFDLLDIDRYRSMCIQTSRGCPFTCEFCDIIEVFGRVPRVKSPQQVLGELDALRALGYRGEVFVVDDNFIANKKAVRSILAELAPWQEKAGHPFTFYTEASLNLASDEKLIAAMREADFTSVFIGIETPDDEVLKQTGKKQNVGMNVRTAVDKLTAAGFEVMAGFIVGFDGDSPASFGLMKQLLYDAPLPLAMAGLLTALPSTALWRRLESEGRLRDDSNGDAFTRPNFQPLMSERALLQSYADLLAELYSVEGYYRRAAALVDSLAPPAHAAALVVDDIAVAARTVVKLGMVGPRRRAFWRLMGRALPRGIHAVYTAIACAVRGEHMIRYTEEVVLPRLARAIASVPDAVASAEPVATQTAVPKQPVRLPLAPRAP